MKSDRQGPDVGQVADAIRRHLAAHPHAADTAAGIQRWWVLPACGEVSLTLVEDALAQLEASGEIQRDEAPWSHEPVHRAAPRHRPEGL
jgi:hypothetical protein